MQKMLIKYLRMFQYVHINLLKIGSTYLENKYFTSQLNLKEVEVGSL